VETTEYALKLARQLDEKLEECRVLTEYLADLPIGYTKAHSVYTELCRSGHPDPVRATQNINQLIRIEISAALSAAKAGTETLTATLDDVIGTTGRLV
jgi:hypothetical protein